MNIEGKDYRVESHLRGDDEVSSDCGGDHGPIGQRLRRLNIKVNDPLTESSLDNKQYKLC